jgi:hypothetical protein
MARVETRRAGDFHQPFGGYREVRNTRFPSTLRRMSIGQPVVVFHQPFDGCGSLLRTATIPR